MKPIVPNEGQGSEQLEDEKSAGNAPPSHACLTTTPRLRNAVVLPWKTSTFLGNWGSIILIMS